MNASVVALSRSVQANRSWLTLVGDAFRSPAVWLSLALTFNVLEGAVRKWVPGFSSGYGRILAYFSKDLCLALGVILILNKPKILVPAMKVAEKWGCLAFALLICGGAVSALAQINVVGAVLSLRALLVLPVLAYCYVTRVRRFPLLGFALVVALLAISNAPLAILQNSLPAGHVLNQYAAEEMQIVKVKYGVRATGTFAYITGLGVLAAAGVWAGMVVLSLARSRGVQMLGVLAVLASVTCAFASISRGTVVIVFAMLGLWALSSIRVSRLISRSLWGVAAIALLSLLLAPGVAERFIYVGEGALDRFETAGDSNLFRAFGQFSELWAAAFEHPEGTGLGTEQVAGNYAARGRMSFTQYESQFPRIVAEFGILGFAGFVLLAVAVLSALQVSKKGHPSWRWKLIVTATQIYLLGQLYGSLVFNHTGSAMIWIIATAVLAAAPTQSGSESRMISGRDLSFASFR